MRAMTFLTVAVNIVLLGYETMQSSRWFAVFKRSMLLPFMGVQKQCLSLK